MQTTNDNQDSRFNDSVWYSLAEYSLSVLDADMDTRDELSASALFQSIRDLGIPAEHLNNIERTLVGFANEAMTHHNQGEVDLPVYIRLFCQKKAFNKVNLARTIHHLTAEHSVQTAPTIHHPDKEMNGGWGYFLIKRNGGFVLGSSVNTDNLVDLYLYKEGE